MRVMCRASFVRKESEIRYSKSLPANLTSASRGERWSDIYEVWITCLQNFQAWKLDPLEPLDKDNI